VEGRNTVTIPYTVKQRYTIKTHLTYGTKVFVFSPGHGDYWNTMDDNGGYTATAIASGSTTFHTLLADFAQYRLVSAGLKWTAIQGANAELPEVNVRSVSNYSDIVSDGGTLDTSDLNWGNSVRTYFPRQGEGGTFISTPTTSKAEEFDDVKSSSMGDDHWDACLIEVSGAVDTNYISVEMIMHFELIPESNNSLSRAASKPKPNASPDMVRAANEMRNKIPKLFDTNDLHVVDSLILDVGEAVANQFVPGSGKLARGALSFVSDALGDVVDFLF
jgi:hypothetical protein